VRMIFGLASLLIVVVIIGLLTKKQLSAVTQLPNAVGVTATDATKPANIAVQSKQMQQQVKDQMDEAMKAATQAREKALESGNTDKPAEKTGSAY
jgi:phosphoribosylcarboxyaminoimidazole (NCAIR) mutase